MSVRMCVCVCVCLCVYTHSLYISILIHTQTDRHTHTHTHLWEGTHKGLLVLKNTNKRRLTCARPPCPAHPTKIKK